MVTQTKMMKHQNKITKIIPNQKTKMYISVPKSIEIEGVILNGLLTELSEIKLAEPVEIKDVSVKSLSGEDCLIYLTGFTERYCRNDISRITLNITAYPQ